jgi:hypothetical protein
VPQIKEINSLDVNAEKNKLVLYVYVSHLECLTNLQHENKQQSFENEGRVKYVRSTLTDTNPHF